MTLLWKYLRLGIIPVLLLFCAGCSGINASHSISPASFFLPGLIQVQPEQPVLPLDPEQVPILIAVNSPIH